MSAFDQSLLDGKSEADGPWYEMEERAGEVIPGFPSTDTGVRQVMYSFYKKPMAARLTMLAKSALNNKTKVATVSAETLRRLKRTTADPG